MKIPSDQKKKEIEDNQKEKLIILLIIFILKTINLDKKNGKGGSRPIAV